VAESPTPEPPVSDAELLRRHLEGDAEAFPALVRRYRRELFSFLARYTADASLAEDVFQEAFLQLFLSAAAFDPKRPLKPWLFTIATNKARDAMRSRSRRQAAPLDAAVSAADEEGARYVDLMCSDVPSPEEAILNLETRQTVQRIVAGMPENLRAVLLLAYFHELPYKDIAEALNVPLGTVKSRLHAAVRCFAGLWKAAERTRHGRTDKQ
jgi:RNA polymerase sigma-70 factor (ECF subfamily)